VYLAAGAGGMYCGSCLRDNRLAATLRAQGRDIVLVPLYTPLRTDEPDVSNARVSFGGINVYLSQVFPAIRFAPAFVRRFFDSGLLLRLAGRLSSRTAARTLGPLTVAVLRGENGPQGAELERLIDTLRELRPDVVNLANLLFIGQARRIHEALGVPVICTLSGEDLFIDQLPPRWRDEAIGEIRRRATDVHAYISVTNYFAARAVDYFGLPAERMHVVPLGVSPEHFLANGSNPDRAARPFTIGYFARIAPEKGLDVLVDAFVELCREGRDCRLIIGGYRPETARKYFEGAWQKLVQAGVADRCLDVGEPDLAGKVEFFQSIDVLSVPAVYPEAKGLYVLEAMAAGTPVVQPRTGSFPELVETSGGGLLYDSVGPDGLAPTLARLMDEPGLRARLGKSGQAAVARHFSAAQMAERTWRIYERLASPS
jgi:glycosyltransferase involved in cell wall biosynthesis